MADEPQQSACSELLHSFSVPFSLPSFRRQAEVGRCVEAALARAEEALPAACIVAPMASHWTLAEQLRASAIFVVVPPGTTLQQALAPRWQMPSLPAPRHCACVPQRHRAGAQL